MARRYARRGCCPRSWRGNRLGDVLISIAQDPIQCVTAALIFGIVAVMLILGSICVWPYFVSKAFAGGSFDAASPFGKMLVLGGISAGLGLVVAVYLCWFFEWKSAEEFSLRRIWMIIFMAEIVSNFILIPIFGVNLLAVSDPDAWVSILSLLVHGILGIMTALVPSFFAALLGYCANGIWYLTHRHLL